LEIYIICRRKGISVGAHGTRFTQLNRLIRNGPCSAGWFGPVWQILYSPKRKAYKEMHYIFSSPTFRASYSRHKGFFLRQTISLLLKTILTVPFTFVNSFSFSFPFTFTSGNLQHFSFMFCLLEYYVK